MFYRWILEFQHVDPAEAVNIHQDIKSKCSIGMHWGTFKTSACEVLMKAFSVYVKCILSK
jgi:L-ascorbate metabolism protein UlaG (beta-lactamase superfamily)